MEPVQRSLQTEGSTPDLYTPRESFALKGFAVRTTNAAELGDGGRIPGLWQTYMNSSLAGEEGVRDPHLIYALYTDYESDASGAYTVVVGHESAAEDSGVSETYTGQGGSELLEVRVPGSRYRIFRTRRGPMGEVAAETWGEIWAYYAQSSEQRAYTGDFEVYDTRNFDPQAVEILIYIAVR
ncbi:GyrI-like domain-containing protein [Saccharibacillus qingshengii]|uniref:GyrI-like domain-containing protein n=1 Tax=Saccharibacillus qingshengii TaxID=1763540 RepID=UPI00155646F9|nr:effector binding domain-containing protein [Saccharibacillus qingshengii]